MTALELTNAKIESLRNQYDALQPLFRMPNADFKALSQQEDLINEQISALVDIRILLEIEQDNEKCDFYIYGK